MNIKRLIPAFLAVFVFIFAFEWMFHGILLGNIYAQSPDLWRPPQEMLFRWLLLGQAVIALILCLIVAVSSAGGAASGLRLGILLALMGIGVNFITYAVQPLPSRL